MTDNLQVTGDDARDRKVWKQVPCDGNKAGTYLTSVTHGAGQPEFLGGYIKQPEKWFSVGFGPKR